MKMHSHTGSIRAAVLVAAVVLAFSGVASAAALPDPDGKPADMSKPVQVYILLGQSNMLGFGKADQLKGIAAEKYPYMVDDSGAWTVRQDVRNVRVMTSGNKPAKDITNTWMTVSGNFGPEHGIGHHIGNVTDAPVMILKSCIGNRSLGWDLLPPGSEPFEFEDKGKVWRYAGYKESPMKWKHAQMLLLQRSTILY